MMMKPMVMVVVNAGAVVVAAAVLLMATTGCETSEPSEPADAGAEGTNVEVMREGSIVDVDADESRVYVGEEGVRVRTRGANVDIGGGGGIRIW